MNSKTFLSTVLFAAVLLVLAGCKTTEEAENRSARPWNSPKSWEHGIPSMINEGR